MVGATGRLGSEAVYRHGLGVMSLPKVEGEGHAHSHGDGGHADLSGMVQGEAPEHAGGDHHADGHSH